jgi:hypothetical protein
MLFVLMGEAEFQKQLDQVLLLTYPSLTLLSTMGRHALSKEGREIKDSHEKEAKLLNAIQGYHNAVLKAHEENTKVPTPHSYAILCDINPKTFQ